MTLCVCVGGGGVGVCGGRAGEVGGGVCVSPREYRNQLSSSLTWIVGTKLKSPVLTASGLPCCITLTSHSFLVLRYR